MNGYRPYRPFFKHLHNLVISGFYTRELDADDFQFLEYVRARGSANGSLPGASTVLLEELEFWNWPYTIAPDVARRIGPQPRPVATIEQRAMRQARSLAWRARRVIRANENAIAEAELARERRAWQEADQKRKRRALISDVEWEAAAPRQAKFGATVGRHYVPQWKVDEQRSAEKRKQRAAEAAREQEQRAAEATREREQERKRREQVIEEARKTVDRANALEREWRAAAAAMASNPSAGLKSAIRLLIRSSTPYVWTVDEVMRATGCSDAAFVRSCLEELVREGHLRKGPA